MRARYYDPGTGRFVSEDPGCNGNNWYIYAGDNPVNMADQDGKSSDWVSGLALLLGGIALRNSLFLMVLGAFELAAFCSSVLAVGCFESSVGHHSGISPYIGDTMNLVAGAGGAYALSQGLAYAKTVAAGPEAAEGVGGGIAVTAIVTAAIEGAIALGVMAWDN
jgi:hypothetical protein